MRLVDRLPIGSKLTAVFDSCHSGTLLDLDHYLCNEVYHPFLCRDPSRQRSWWMRNGELQPPSFSYRVLNRCNDASERKNACGKILRPQWNGSR